MLNQWFSDPIPLSLAQAAIAAYGQGNQNGRISWVEDLFNYKKVFGVDSHLICGLKKTRFNGQDFGTMVVSTYAVEP